MSSRQLLGQRRKGDNMGALPPLSSLKCGVCHEYLNDPVTLPCLHSFCRNCLEKYNANVREKERQALILERGDSFDSSYAKEEKTADKTGELDADLTVLCPTCIQDLKLDPPNEPQVPFENSRLARIVGLVHDSNIVCQNCSETTSELKCNTCNAWLCVECKEATHSAPIFKTHITVPLTHSEMMALPKCETHPLNELEFFSTEEEVGVCQVCLLKGDFVGKPYCLVSDVRKARQHELERGVKVVLEEKERLVAGRAKMEQIIDLLDKKLLTQTEAVKSNFVLIRQALDKREAETLESLKSLKATKDTVLKAQMGHTDRLLNVLNDAVSNVRLILNHSNDLELVYLTIVLQEFIAEVSQLKFAEENIDFYHTPAVDANLPVSLSDKVVSLISAYAPVPKAIVEIPSNKELPVGPTTTKPKGALKDMKKQPKGKATGETGLKISMEKLELTNDQKKLLEEVGASAKQADEYGCSLM